MNHKILHKASQDSSDHVRSSFARTRRYRVIVNVYDLLPPGKVSTVLWAVGSSLLHTGVVVDGREYAFGGHDRKDMSGVYWTAPNSVPPGGTFRCEILHGFAICSTEELANVIQEASRQFLGPAYNLLSNNCNHFTSYLCSKLTGKAAPSWINRAASLGIAFPCVVPREWLAPPTADNADGELVDETDDDESTAMLDTYRQPAEGVDGGFSAGTSLQISTRESRGRVRTEAGKLVNGRALIDSSEEIQSSSSRPPGQTPQFKQTARDC